MHRAGDVAFLNLVSSGFGPGDGEFRARSGVSVRQVDVLCGRLVRRERGTGFSARELRWF